MLFPASAAPRPRISPWARERRIGRPLVEGVAGAPLERCGGPLQRCSRVQFQAIWKRTVGGTIKLNILSWSWRMSAQGLVGAIFRSTAPLTKYDVRCLKTLLWILKLCVWTEFWTRIWLKVTYVLQHICPLFFSEQLDTVHDEIALKLW